MIINGAYDRSVDFRLSAFEYKPGNFNPEEDWIDIDFLIKSEKQKWQVTDASLLAAEVLQLAQWLRDIAEDKPVQKDLYFIEPCLSFHYMYNYGKTMNILITFNAELRPGWYKEDKMFSILGHVGHWQLPKQADELVKSLHDLYMKAGVAVQPFTYASPSSAEVRMLPGR